MRRIRFLCPADIYNGGDIAGFPDHLAAMHVRRGRAVYDDDPVPAERRPADGDADEKAQSRPPADKLMRPGKGGVVTK